MVSLNGLEEVRFQVFCEKVQRRQQQEVVEKEVSIITVTFGESYSLGRRKPAQRFLWSPAQAGPTVFCAVGDLALEDLDLLRALRMHFEEAVPVPQQPAADTHPIAGARPLRLR